MFHLSKSLRRSSRVFRETKRIEGRPARPSIHRAIRRGARGERILMIQHELVQLGRGLLRRIQTSLPTEERRTDARDESFHGAFLFMFVFPKASAIHPECFVK